MGAKRPGAAALLDRSAWPRLHAYAKGVVGSFAQDSRVLAWDVWNEPDNLNPDSYGSAEPSNKLNRVNELLPRTFEWVRGAQPSQPLTTPLWHGDRWSSPESLSAIERIQIEQSDILSFHDYGPATSFERRLRALQVHGRPVLCTEYLARPLGSTFQSILPAARALGVTAINWGLVAGKTETYLPWDSWQHPYRAEPSPWFQDVLRPDGAPYQAEKAAVMGDVVAGSRRREWSDPDGCFVRLGTRARPTTLTCVLIASLMLTTPREARDVEAARRRARRDDAIRP